VQVFDVAPPLVFAQERGDCERDRQTRKHRRNGDSDAVNATLIRRPTRTHCLQRLQTIEAINTNHVVRRGRNATSNSGAPDYTDSGPLIWRPSTVQI